MQTFMGKMLVVREGGEVHAATKEEIAQALLSGMLGFIFGEKIILDDLTVLT